MKKLIVLGLIAGLGFWFVSLKPTSYADIRAGFLEGCSGNGDSVASCECLLKELSTAIPFEEFQAENEKINAGDEPTEGFAKALEAAFTSCHETESGD